MNNAVIFKDRNRKLIKFLAISSILTLSACGGDQGSSSESSSTSSQSSNPMSSSSVSSSTFSSSQSSGGNSSANPISANDCQNILHNPNVNWNETGADEQSIIQCLYDSLGRPVGYGEEAQGGYSPDASNLIVINRDGNVLPERQLMNAIDSEAANWIVFDKDDFAQEPELAMYRLHCQDDAVLSALDNASEIECLDHTLWCNNRGINQNSCAETFFNDHLNNNDLPIRNVMIKSNTTIDGRGSNATFLFNGFAIGADSSGASTYEAKNVILTHLTFEGAGHSEDHGLDPDMIRSTGESNQIWIHKNTFNNTGDSAFDVKVGAHHITISFNRLHDVLRASLHGSSDSREINSQITTTMHNNFFITTDEFYNGSHRADNTARRVPLLRRGSSHMFNNVFYNYRKNFGSVRVGATLQMENNIFLGGTAISSEKSSLQASFDEWLVNLTKEKFDGGQFSSTNDLVTFANDNCQIESSYQGNLPSTLGQPARDLSQDYSPYSRNMIEQNKLNANQDLVNYLIQTTGAQGQASYLSPDAPSISEMISSASQSCY